MKNTKQLDYSNYILSYPSMPSLISTDESMVPQNMKKRGIWRKRYCYPEGSFAFNEQHPISPMVWGGIGPNGFKTLDLKCSPRMIALTDASMLAENIILYLIGQSIPNFIWR